MASERMRKQWLNDLKNLEDKIKEIYYLNDFETAKNFENRIEVLKQKLLSLSSNEDSYIFEQEERNIIAETVKISLEVDNYLKSNQKTKGTEINKIRYTNKLNEIVSSLETSTTEELWERLNRISDEWNNASYGEIEKQTIKDESAKVALEILKAQAPKGEVIDINAINGICGKEELVKVMQSKLIKVAETQDEKNKINILYMTRGLNAENINDALVWKVLTNIKDVMVAELEIIKDIQSLEGPDELDENGEITVSAVVEKQKSWLEKITEKLKKATKRTTVYTVGEINPDNGEWENVKEIVDKYPKKLKLKGNQKLLAIEFNDIEEVKAFYDMNLYNEGFFSDVQKIKFGNRVKKIEENTFLFCRSLKEIVCGDDLEEIGKGVFSSCRSLEKVTLGKNIKNIGQYAFATCTSLKNVTLPEGLLEIEYGAFTNSGIERIEIPDSVKYIGTFAFSVCINLKEVTFGEGITRINDSILAGTSIERVRFPDSVTNVDLGAVRGCKNLKEMILGNKEGRLYGLEVGCDNLRIWAPKDIKWDFKGAISFFRKIPVLHYDPNKNEEDREYNQIKKERLSREHSKKPLLKTRKYINKKYNHRDLSHEDICNDYVSIQKKIAGNVSRYERSF